jgi:Concanavalin A-like lectin/glucanases superfamily/Secretion system C-terminal sorting domain
MNLHHKLAQQIHFFYICSFTKNTHMKKLLFILISLCFSTGIFAQTITDSLILYYPFNGNTNDWSGNAFNGTNGGATLTADHNGIANSAYSFDGVNDYIDMPNHPSLHPDYPFSMAAWVKAYNPSYSGFNFLMTEFNAIDIYSGAWLQVGSSIQKFYAAVGDGGIVSSASRNGKFSSQIINVSTWYYLVAVYESFSSIKVYVNCVEDVGYYTGTGSSYNKNMSWHGSIGRADGGSINYADGIIDEVAIWNRALNTDEIAQLCETDLWQIIQASTAEDNLEIFSVYPNPIVNEAIINFNNSTQEKHQIVIRNINGQEVQKYDNITSSNCVIQKGNLAAGVYILELQNTVTKTQINQKIIIQ